MHQTLSLKESTEVLTSNMGSVGDIANALNIKAIKRKSGLKKIDSTGNKLASTDV